MASENKYTQRYMEKLRSLRVRNWFRLFVAYLPVFVFWLLILLDIHNWYSQMKVAIWMQEIPDVFWALGMMCGLGLLGWRLVYWHALELEDHGFIKTPIHPDEELSVIELDVDEDE